MSGDPSDTRDPSPFRHHTRPSLVTSASGIADSTISFNTYATGITEGSLCLSQFPPPPMTIPSTSSPTTERFLPSPAQSTFTITGPPRAGPSTDQASPSPSRSTFEVSSFAPLSPMSGSAPSIARQVFVPQQGLPSPTQSTFTIVSPASPIALLPRHSATDAQPNRLTLNRERPRDPSPFSGLGKTERSQNSDPQGPHSPTSKEMTGKLSPYDWHEGSSIITVDPAEERMLSTSFITGLLSSSASLKTPDALHRGFHPPSPADVDSLVSEMSYPPSPHYHEPVAGPSHSPRRSRPLTLPEEGFDYRTDGGHDTVTSHSYERHADVVQRAPGLTKMISVVGMAPATLRHIGSVSSILESLNPQSRITDGSTAPLNLHPPSELSSGIGNMALTDSQPVIRTSQLLTSEASMSRGFTLDQSSIKAQRRASAYSSRTVRSHVSSLISSAGHHTARATRATLEWLRVKPLPRLPTIPNVSLSQEQEHRRMESAVPLPQLAERADQLTAMLDIGRLPHDSIRSSPKFGSDKDTPSGMRGSGFNVATGGSGPQSVIPGQSQPGIRQRSFFKRPISRSLKIKLFIGVSLLVLLVLIGIIVGVTVGHKNAHSLSCPVNRAGNTCSLDSTCVCTSSNSSQCDPLAQSLVSLVPIVNDQFNANFTLSTVANAMSLSGVSAASDDCAAQARVVDVSPALDSQSVPNRTEWTQGALLWAFVLSQNTSAVGKLRDFVAKAKWESLPEDGPVTGQSSEFSTTQLGYTFDFAAQTISEPNVSFISDGQPPSGQLAQVDNTARAALDRMYTFASASSTLRATAMTNYWQNVLRQDPSQFSTFVSLMMSSPILMPFDANGTAGHTSISSLLTNSSSTPFPPPLSCYPGLTQSQLQLITNLETSIFGLSAPATQDGFSDSCFADRPIYGVLNILHLRLPFQDSQSGAKQGAILSRDAISRVVVYAGEVLSGFPTSDTSSIPTDPRQFGTLAHMSHVLLDFFEAIPDINVATQFVKYVLSYPATPPTNDTLLGQSLNTIPTLEVAIFGSVTPSDVTGVVSSFTTPSGDLFFGTSESLAVRDWAMVATQTSVTWTEFANSPKIVDDNSFTDAAFNMVWNPAYLFFHSSTDAIVNVGNITAGFAAVNKFTNT
ncbi:hypothetical protein BC827DRAFT_1167481 [Russula dissimulans]|nr:hypothetical protein BC827DRAFT_1167481 [Russula dissimulans]